MDIEKATRQQQMYLYGGAALTSTGMALNVVAISSHQTLLTFAAIVFLVVGVVQLSVAAGMGKKLAADKDADLR